MIRKSAALSKATAWRISQSILPQKSNKKSGQKLPGDNEDSSSFTGNCVLLFNMSSCFSGCAAQISKNSSTWARTDGRMFAFLSSTIVSPPSMSNASRIKPEYISQTTLGMVIIVATGASAGSQLLVSGLSVNTDIIVKI